MFTSAIVALYCVSILYVSGNAIENPKVTVERTITINKNGNLLTTKLNITDNLADLRSKLQQADQMKREDNFLRAIRGQKDEHELSVIRGEKEFKLSEIIQESDGDAILYIGHPTRQVKNLAYNFLHGMRYSGNKWELSPEKVAEFDGNYQPTLMRPHHETEFESNYTLSKETFEKSIEGIRELSASVDVSTFFSAKGSHQDSSNQQQSSSVQTVYSFARVLCNRRDVTIDVSRLVPSAAFVDEIEFIMNGSYMAEVERAKDMVLTMKKYGWFIPVHYTLGGAFREHEITRTTDLTDIEKRSESLKAELKIAFGSVFAASGGMQDTSSSSVTQGSRSETRSIKKTSVGANGAIDMQTFITNVDKEENWQIIQHKQFYSTLMLLEKDHSWLLRAVVKLLNNHFYKPRVKQLESNVDLEKYLGELRGAVAVNPF